MLDLTTQIEKPFEVKLLNGDVLRLHKPTQKMLIKLTKVMKEQDAEVVVDNIFGAFVDILNCNMEGKTYCKEDVENYSLDLISLVLTEYFNSVQEELKK